MSEIRTSAFFHHHDVFTNMYHLRPNFCRLFGVASFVLLISCRNDKPNPIPETQTSVLHGKNNVLITNEGTFQFRNGSLSLVSGSDGIVKNDIGLENKWDVVQSVVVYEERIYVVVNNSGKISILDAYSFQPVGEITGLRSPRYIQIVSNTKAYVSDEYSNSIAVVDLNTREITKQIPTKLWTEQMVYHLGKIYACTYYYNYLYEIDPLTDIITDSIQIGLGAKSVVVDKHDRLIVACGDVDLTQSERKLVFVNPFTKTVEKKILFSSGYPEKITINPTSDTIYYLKSDIFKMSVAETQAPSQAFISGVGKSFYGLGIDRTTNQVFVADAVDYVQKGSVYVYTSSGNLVSQFKTGIIPNGFCFYE